MALRKCNECGKNVSDRAVGCPACGAPAPKRTGFFTYLIGGLFALIVASCVVESAMKPSPPAAAGPAMVAIATPPQDCSKIKAELIQKANVLINQKQPWEAQKVIRYCAEKTSDIDLLRLSALAIASDARIDIANEKLAPSVRLKAVERLVEADPTAEVGIKGTRARLEQIEARADQENRRRDAAEKRKAGVSIGMSKEDVLASQWGRPQHINTTHNVYGIHEQWVYGGGYLYFENGVLTSIQN